MFSKKGGMMVSLKMTLQWILLLIVGLAAFQARAEKTLTLKTPKDMESYAMGVELTRNWQRQGVDFDLDIVIRGMKDALSGNRLLLSEPDLQTSLNMATSQLRQKKAQVRLTVMQDNKSKGEAFWAENKAKEGVVTLPSGLQYKILKAGTGKRPTDADTVECRYRGTHIDGTEFDSSYGKEQPAIFKLSGVISGWREALKLMPVGSKWQLFIPPQLAYGQQGSGHIGPNETIVFEIELIDVQ
jgi:FKBP-type peptidyl-prolyl cis-trans isomerase